MKRILYLGTDPKEFARKMPECIITHYPVIEIVPRSLDDSELRQAYADLDKYTHAIFTSKNAARIVCNHLEELRKPFPAIQVISVGAVTASTLEKRGITSSWVAQEETQEGIISLLKTFDLDQAYLFIPKSSLSREVLFEFLRTEKIAHRACTLYDTVAREQIWKPNWEEYDQIVFTSPSVVKAFLSLFGCIPDPKQCLVIGPITKQALDEFSLYMKTGIS